MNGTSEGEGRSSPAQPSPSDAEREDFEAFFRSTFPALIAFLRGQGASPDLAQDAAAEAMVELYKHSHSDKPRIANPKAWVYTVARRIMFKNLRAEQKRSTVHEQLADELADDLSWLTPPAADLAESRILTEELLARYRATAGPRERAVLELLLDGFTYREIAEKLLISESSARTYVARLRDRLRHIEHQMLSTEP